MLIQLCVLAGGINAHHYSLWLSLHLYQTVQSSAEGAGQMSETWLLLVPVSKISGSES